MGDIRIKISGTSEPFLTRVFNATCSSVVSYKHVEYSGETVHFGNLAGSTCYNLSVTDRIGGVVWTGFTTPTALVAPELPSRELTISGELWSPWTNICAVRGGDDNEQPFFQLNPSLKMNESICFTVDAITCNIMNSNNQISFWCCQDGDTSYTCLAPSYSNDGCETRIFCMNYCDNICYRMNTSFIAGVTGDICGYSCLCVIGITGTCVNGSIGTPDSICTNVDYVVPTTTTTTTLSPITVCLVWLNTTYFDNSFNGRKAYVCGCLSFSRPLVLGESVRVNYVTEVRATKNSSQSTHSICSEVYVDRYNTNECYGYDDYTIPASQAGGGASIINALLNITSTNQNIPQFCMKVSTHYLDTHTLDACLRSQIRLISLTNQVGANFNIHQTCNWLGAVADFFWAHTPNTGLCQILTNSGPTPIDGCQIIVVPDGSGGI